MDSDRENSDPEAKQESSSSQDSESTRQNLISSSQRSEDLPSSTSQSITRAESTEHSSSRRSRDFSPSISSGSIKDESIEQNIPSSTSQESISHTESTEDLPSSTRRSEDLPSVSQSTNQDESREQNVPSSSSQISTKDLIYFASQSITQGESTDLPSSSRRSPEVPSSVSQSIDRDEPTENLPSSSSLRSTEDLPSVSQSIDRDESVENLTSTSSQRSEDLPSSTSQRNNIQSESAAHSTSISQSTTQDESVEENRPSSSSARFTENLPSSTSQESLCLVEPAEQNIPSSSRGGINQAEPTEQNLPSSTSQIICQDDSSKQNIPSSSQGSTEYLPSSSRGSTIQDEFTERNFPSSSQGSTEYLPSSQSTIQYESTEQDISSSSQIHTEHFRSSPESIIQDELAEQNLPSSSNISHKEFPSTSQRSISQDESIEHLPVVQQGSSDHSVVLSQGSIVQTKSPEDLSSPSQRSNSFTYSEMSTVQGTSADLNRAAVTLDPLVNFSFQLCVWKRSEGDKPASPKRQVKTELVREVSETPPKLPRMKIRVKGTPYRRLQIKRKDDSTNTLERSECRRSEATATNTSSPSFPKEKIVLCLDASPDPELPTEDSSLLTHQSLVELIKWFISSKCLMNEEQEFAIFLISDKCSLLHDFTKCTSNFLAAINQLSSPIPGRSCDLKDLLPEICDISSIPSAHPDDPETIPPFIVRNILIYIRSTVVPTIYDSAKQNLSLVQSPYLITDVVYVHDGQKECQHVYKELRQFCDSRSYILDCGRNTDSVREQMTWLLTHALQRQLQSRSD